MITGGDVWAWGLMAALSHCLASDAAMQAAPLGCLHPLHPCDLEPCLSCLPLIIQTKVCPL